MNLCGKRMQKYSYITKFFLQKHCRWWTIIFVISEIPRKRLTQTIILYVQFTDLKVCTRYSTYLASRESKSWVRCTYTILLVVNYVKNKKGTYRKICFLNLTHRLSIICLKCYQCGFTLFPHMCSLHMYSSFTQIYCDFMWWQKSCKTLYIYLKNVCLFDFAFQHLRLHIH